MHCLFTHTRQLRTLTGRYKCNTTNTLIFNRCFGLRVSRSHQPRWHTISRLNLTPFSSGNYMPFWLHSPVENACYLWFTFLQIGVTCDVSNCCGNATAAAGDSGESAVRGSNIYMWFSPAFGSSVDFFSFAAKGPAVLRQRKASPSDFRTTEWELASYLEKTDLDHIRPKKSNFLRASGGLYDSVLLQAFRRSIRR